MENNDFIDYGDRAVNEPSKKALAYGEKAIDAGKKSVNKSNSAKSKPNAPQKVIAKPTNLTVNTASQLNLNSFATHLKQSSLPKGIRDQIKVSGNKIHLPGSIPKGVPNSQWLKDLLSIGEDWELTTGELQFVLRPDMRFWGSRVMPDLDNQGSYGFLRRAPTEDDPSPLIVTDANKCWIVDGIPSGANIGLTVPNFKLIKHNFQTGKDADRIVLLDSGRGLIIIANRSKFYLLAKESGCWNPENLSFFIAREKQQPKIGKWLVRNGLLHELSGHAGLLSQRLPAEHNDDPNSRVESNVRAINSIDNNFEKENGKLFVSIMNEFDFLSKAKISN